MSYVDYQDEDLASPPVDNSTDYYAAMAAQSGQGPIIPPPAPTLQQIEAFRRKSIDDGLKSGHLYWEQNQIEERRKNAAAIAHLQSLQGISEDQRQKEIVAFAKANDDMVPLPTPIEKIPPTVPEQLAQSVYVGPDGTRYERSPKNPQFWMHANHQPEEQQDPDMQSLQQAKNSVPPPGFGAQVPGFGMQAPSNQPQPMQGQPQDQLLSQPAQGVAVQGQPRNIALEHWYQSRTVHTPNGDIFIGNDGKPVPVKTAPQPDKVAQIKEKQEEDKRRHAEEDHILQEYDRNIARQQKMITEANTYNSKIIDEKLTPKKEVPELDTTRALQEAQDAVSNIRQSNDPNNKKYQGYLENQFDGMSMADLMTQYAMMQKTSPLDVVEIKDEMTRRANGHISAPDGWKPPVERKSTVAPDPEILSFMQGKTAGQMKDWMFHATRESPYSKTEFEKEYPDKDYQQYIKIRGYLKQNAPLISQQWQYLKTQPPITVPQQTPQAPATEAPKFKPSTDNLSVPKTGLPVLKSKSEYDQFEGGDYQMPDGSIWHKPKKGNK